MHHKLLSIQDRAKNIQMFIMDIDGVLTDGRIIYTSDGQEMKNFDVRDGFGIRLAHRAGIKTTVITARQSSIVARRSLELEITEIRQNALKKLPVYEEILLKYQLQDEQIAYIGDDLIDMPILRRVGLSITVADAHPEVKQMVHYITENKGGRGAVRESIEMILKAQGSWQKATERYF